MQRGRPRKEISLYLPADKEIIFNESDPDLTPLRVPLPEPPPLELIDGYGLHPDEQFYHRPQIPPALKDIQKRNPNSIADCWAELDLRRNELSNEIIWLKKQWYYRLNGYWCFIHGKPVYLSPAHALLLGFCRLNVGIPQYRDRGRKVHNFIEWASKYHYDFKEKRRNDKGERIANLPGDELEDVGERTIIGIVEPKGRRLTESTNALVWMLNRATVQLRGLNGIQGYDEKSSSEPYKEFVKVFRTLPFFFLPEFNKDSESMLRLVKTGGNLFDDQGLQTVIEPAITGHSGHFDGREVTDYWLDEAGKKTREKLSIGWQTCKNFLTWSSGKVINGFAILPSNSGEYKKGGGREYLDLIKDSNYYERTEDGRTRSGLVTLFIPSNEGAPGFINKYGESMKDNATRHFLSMRQSLLAQDTPESIEKYQKVCREQPLELRDCFLYDSGVLGYNPIIVNKRIGELTFLRTKPSITGNFSWSAGRHSPVKFTENPFGRWCVSKLLPEGQANKKVNKGGVWYSMYPKSFMHGSDAFNYSTTEGKKKSKGSGIVIERRVFSKNEEEDVSKWTTPDVVCTYLARPATLEEYAEDMLLQTIYYGGEMNPESNNEIVRAYFIKNGYAGYLYYYRESDGTYKTTAGYVKVGNTADRIVGASTRFIELHGHRCNHIELLEQCKEFRGIEDITRLDLLAAHCGACDGIENDWRADQYIPPTQSVSISDIFTTKIF